jgi:hypothetical protein
LFEDEIANKHWRSEIKLVLENLINMQNLLSPEKNLELNFGIIKKSCYENIPIFSEMQILKLIGNNFFKSQNKLILNLNCLLKVTKRDLKC